MKSRELSNQPEADQPDFGDDTKQHRISDIQDERLTEAIRRIETGRDPSARFETQLILEGLLPGLEQAKILPVVKNPNPFDPEDDEERHEQWWKENPEEATDFERNVDKRNEVLRHLYVGSIIGSGPWNIP
jgi:hypothetical protein